MTQSIEAKLLSVLVASVLALASYAIVASTVPITVHATTGMGNCKAEDDCTRQPDRVGADNDDPDNEGEDADRDGPGGSDESPETEEDDDPNTPENDEANCWGKVSSALGKQQNEIEGPAHASNPTPDADNDTPREGVGNQKEGHPSDHADTVGGFSGIEEDCVD
jgi:hypothetical protein